MATRIESLDHLKAEASKPEPLDCFILLGGGARSSKMVRYWPPEDEWDVYHGISDTWEEDLSTEALRQTNILTALEEGALYAY